MKGGAVTGIAWALMLAKWRQTMVAGLGVMFGITMFVTMLGFMTGLNHLLDGLILNRTPHVRIYHELKATAIQPVEKALKGQQHFIRTIRPLVTKNKIRNSEAITTYLSKHPDVAGVAPRVASQVFYSLGTSTLGGTLQGVDVATEARTFHLSDYVTEGNITDLINVPNSIIIGKGIAEILLLKIGDPLEVVMPGGSSKRLKVVGYFQSGIKDIDKILSYTDVRNLQSMMDVSTDHYTEIFVNLKDIKRAPDLAGEIAQLFEVDAEDIQKANSQFETGTKVRTIISYSVGITLLIVAGFGIYNILNMLIYEKMDTIAILKAMGYSGSDVKKIFSLISVSIGIAGGVAGMIMGFILSNVIDQIPFNTAALPTVKTFPVSYNPVFYALAFAFSFVTTYFAGYFPSRKASQMDPVSIIRGK